MRVVTFNAKALGGGSDPDEDHKTAVKRWFREETGGLIKLHSNVCVAITKEFRNDLQQVYYVADLVDGSGEPALTEGEIGDGHSWVSVRRAQRTMTVAEPTSELGRFTKERDIYLLGDAARKGDQ
ncbi:hypothetical protein NEMBOFW57_000108 [Staphylotrichum longicolle]|uniref:Nudix hydrolase domain-containing protein n=1 Tax=Staphylotrichum longicolle TaxID=669026 RepID=A0AAD4EZ16_9PEZI|nr:hypothetical protein NEMBOFW57_000108 [Staphylotrichum longicolle]